MTDENTPPELETTTTNIGDWRIVKQGLPDGNVRKFMNQRGIDGENDQEVFQIGFQHNEATNETFVEILVPLGVILTEEIKFGIDESTSCIATYQSCFPEGCLATAKVSEELEKELASNEKGFIEFAHVQGGLLNLPFSLKGSTVS